MDNRLLQKVISLPCVNQYSVTFPAKSNNYSKLGETWGNNVFIYGSTIVEHGGLQVLISIIFHDYFAILQYFFNTTSALSYSKRK